MKKVSVSKMEGIARFGYTARGVIYLIIGGLAVLAAFGQGGRTTDSKGALLTLLGQPFGVVLLGIVAAGLVAYALWRFVQAIWDADHHGTEMKGLAVRAALLVSAATHLSLAFFALGVLFGWGAGGGKNTQDWTAWLLSMPFGRWIVGILGLIIIAVGIANIFKSWQAGFESHLKVPPEMMKWVSPVCRFGLAARGVVFMIVGGFFIVAALQFSSGKARGLQGALDALRQQPYGPWLLAIVAGGLFAFGVYSLIESFYRRINAPV